MTNLWLAAVLLSLCCLLPSCLPAGQSMDFPWPAVDNMMVRKGETAVLRCYLEDEASKGARLNRSSIIFAGSDKWSVDPRVSISTSNKRDYSLQIQNVDVTDDGPYTCSVQTQHTPRSMQVHLTVQVPPQICDISTDMIVNEGTNVTLTCLATGKPEPSISWRHISPSVLASLYLRALAALSVLALCPLYLPPKGTPVSRPSQVYVCLLALVPLCLPALVALGHQVRPCIQVLFHLGHPALVPFCLPALAAPPLHRFFSRPRPGFPFRPSHIQLSSAARFLA
ncbi:neuronal growth regulator 1-like [Tachyglossus aculeatus]|uniref:neuronal growth regulator 1-like n=1 Tax=Tachyglossus aculeatus TaxID=9261 RepID=UPI0018F548C3|nr:neuronal growth regulator 1-like [Tachyglossus aculeatus]